MFHNHESRAAEGKAVKNALAKAGINARVSHGKGTAWSWLDINIGEGPFEHNHDRQSSYCEAACPNHEWKSETRRKALEIAQQVTGRHGEYGGNINIMTQNHWDRKLNKSVEIVQPESEKVSA